MIFHPDLAKLILQGRKSATIRSRSGKCPYKPGHDYALQAGKRTLEQRVTIQDVKPMTIPELDLPTARKLGFRTRTELYERWNGSGDIWLITFVLGVHTDEPRIPAAKFGAHGDYVAAASQSLHGSSEEVGSTAQIRFAREAQEGAQIARNGAYSGHIAKLQAVVQEMRAVSEPRAHQNLRGIERQVAALQRRLTAQV